MIGAFDFEHGGRTYKCVPERRDGGAEGHWWWFAVSYDQQRYAPFEVSPSDTRQSVRTRIIEFYEHRLWVRAQPPEPRQRIGGPGRPPSKPQVQSAGQDSTASKARASQPGAASRRGRPSDSRAK